MTRNDALKAIGVSILAILGAQVLQGMLFWGLSILMQEHVPSYVEYLILLPSILSILGGGFFQGRLIEQRNPAIWLITGFLNSAWPFFYQISFTSNPWSWAGTPLAWVSIIAGTLIWIVGVMGARISQQRKPSAQFDKNLLRITGIVVGALFLLNIVSWSMINFSESFQLAKKVDLPLPPNTSEIKSDSPDPRIAAFHRFEATMPAGDESIFKFYQDAFQASGFHDVSAKFQDSSPLAWSMTKEPLNKEEIEVQSESAHWQDQSGKVLVSLYMQAEKANPAQPWQDGEWLVKGIILSRSYSEPPPTPVASPEESLETTPQASLKSTPVASPEPTPGATLGESPETTAAGSPEATP
jgi:hypothetical protein